MRTRVGYAGATTENPTYRDMRGHTEAIQIDFDPAVITYDQLLKVFWQSHDPTSSTWSTQYENVLWYHDDAQRAVALASRDELVEAEGETIRTEIRPATRFWRAEDYHQKYRLRRRADVEERVRGLYESEQAFVDSTLAARLNGALAGYPLPVDDGALTDAEQQVLRDLGL